MSQGKKKNVSHWDASHPGEVARDKLRKEVKAGRIVKPDFCQLCGHSGNLLGHHYRGYAYPLDVWWICHSCNTFPALRHDGTQTIEQARAAMGKHEKIDNSHLDAKLALRRKFLDKYHASTPIHVMDCCQGSKQIWGTLEHEYVLASYWGIDLKKKRGRMMIRGGSQRLLSTPGWTQNVIDIDTYGSPWEHWLALLPNVTQPTTVFMTIGDQGSCVFKPYETGAHLINLPPSTPEILQGMVGKVIAPRILLTRANDYGIMLAEAIEAVADGAHARYLGVHLIPGST